MSRRFNLTHYGFVSADTTLHNIALYWALILLGLALCLPSASLLFLLHRFSGNFLLAQCNWYPFESCKFFLIRIISSSLNPIILLVFFHISLLHVIFTLGASFDGLNALLATSFMGINGVYGFSAPISGTCACDAHNKRH